MEIIDYEFLYNEQKKLTEGYKDLVEDYSMMLFQKNELIKVLQEYIDEIK